MAKKNVAGVIKLQIGAGKANPSPPIAPVFAQRGLSAVIMKFCEAFNSKTEGLEPGLTIPVVVTYYSDKSFTFELKEPPTSVLIMQAIGLNKGSAKPGASIVGTISEAQVREIAKRKLSELTASDLDAAMSMVIGTARSMGVNYGHN